MIWKGAKISGEGFVLPAKLFVILLSFLVFLHPSITKNHSAMDSLSPNLFVRDIHATIDFYEKLGFQLVMTVPDPGKGPLVWAMMSAGQVTLMFQTLESLGEDLPAIRRDPGGSLLFYIKVTGIRDYFERVRDQVTVLHGLQKTLYGATEFSILDNNQYVLTFAEDEVN
jgi:catechol 2,3-dioxygenase-like lactoylglutathione lyase family enzyme